MCCNSTIRTTSEEETICFGNAIGHVLSPGDIVFLTGELGAGKTRLAKGIVSAATGFDPDEVVSPTFTLVNLFEGNFPVYHVDLYRIETDQIPGIGLDEALDESGAIVLEWGEKGRFLDGEHLFVIIGYGETDNTRTITLECPAAGAWSLRLHGIINDWENRPH